MPSPPTTALATYHASPRGGVNHGLPFSYVRARLATGLVVTGILSDADSDADTVTLWERQKYATTTLRTRHLTPLSDAQGPWRFLERLPLCTVPPCAMSTSTMHVTGGIGENMRMEICMPVGNMSKPIKLVAVVPQGDAQEGQLTIAATVEKLGSAARFQAEEPEQRFFVCQRADAQTTDGGVEDGESDSDTMMVTVLIVTKRSNLQLAMALFAWQGVTTFPVDQADFRMAQYIPDKMSRYTETWQGPSRQGSRWKLSHLPKHWSTVYTMHGYAKNIAIDLINRTQGDPVELETALRSLAGPMQGMVTQDVCHLVKSGAMSRFAQEVASLRTAAREAAVEWKAQVTAGRGRITPAAMCAQAEATTLVAEWTATKSRAEGGEILDKNTQDLQRGAGGHIFSLSAPQMDQLNQAIYCIDYAPVEPEVKDRLRDIVLLYNLHGHHGRLVGQYQRTGRFRGFGSKLRTFKEERHAAQKMLTVETLNRMRDDGTPSCPRVKHAGQKRPRSKNIDSEVREEAHWT